MNQPPGLAELPCLWLCFQLNSSDMFLGRNVFVLVETSMFYGANIYTVFESLEDWLHDKPALVETV
jgi:hypothetical protein